LHSEEQVIELFAQNILDAGKAFIESPSEVPFMPNWNRVVSACPDILESIYEAVELDNQ